MKAVSTTDINGICVHSTRQIWIWQWSSTVGFLITVICQTLTIMIVFSNCTVWLYTYSVLSDFLSNLSPHCLDLFAIITYILNIIVFNMRSVHTFPPTVFPSNTRGKVDKLAARPRFPLAPIPLKIDMCNCILLSRIMRRFSKSSIDFGLSSRSIGTFSTSSLSSKKDLPVGSLSLTAPKKA